eukprot:scaffold7684_cov119-Isochrysis_galbana.AAC.13
MSISSYASDSSAASNPHSCEFSLSDPSRQSGMVQPVVNEMFRDRARRRFVSSRFIHFMYNLRFDSESPMDGRFLLLVLGFAPCPVLPFAREKARQL